MRRIKFQAFPPLSASPGEKYQRHQALLSSSHRRRNPIPGSFCQFRGCIGKGRNDIDSNRVQPPAALTTDPSWTALFTVAVGVVAEIGSMLSHGAVVARESGITAVMGIPGKLAALRDGDILHIDEARIEVIIDK